MFVYSYRRNLGSILTQLSNRCLKTTCQKMFYRPGVEICPLCYVVDI